MSATERPLRAPATAAAMPAGPPPTTTRSATQATGTRPAGSSIKSGVVVMSVLLWRRCGSFVEHDLFSEKPVSTFRDHALRLPGDVPFQDAALDHRDDAEEQGGERRSDDDGRIQQRRIEIVGRADDQRADPGGRPDPLADDGADHGGRCGD